MKTFAAFHTLSGRKVIIVGAGEAALRKARLAASAGAEIVFLASGLDPTLLAEFGDRAEFDARTPCPALFAGAALAFVASDDPAIAATHAAMARQAGVAANVVDRPSLSDFLTPAIVDRGDIVVAISSNGAAPVLARRLRASLEESLSPRLGALADFARSFRSAVASVLAPDHRRGFWESVFDGPIAARFLAGDAAGAREEMIAALNHPQATGMQDLWNSGVVHIVGAGPGDPELLTLKAVRVLQSADVILYDRLVGAEILGYARRDATRLYVGKAKSKHAVPQEEIEQALIGYARAGKTVVRLKGGDPFIFGRGGEEVAALQAAGIPVFVTPGVTAATGCAASAKLPLTHRDHAQAVTFVTGHAKSNAEPDLDWRALAALGHTLVVYMGVGAAEAIGRNLIINGRCATTPVAIIENGTTSSERVIKGRLDGLARMMSAAAIRGPALLVIGEVAALADGVMFDEIISAERRAA